MTKKGSGEKLVAENRRARHDYELGDRWEAGLVLMGSEVRSLREGNANLSDAFVLPRGDELYLHNLRIGPYKGAAAWGHEPLRDRKLLLHRAEIDRILQRIREKGFTVIPTRLYFKNGRAKVEIALARGKTKGDRREAIKERETRREMDRAIAEARRRYR
ncbi:MAG TPA: SsrA-binding protein SmpB [Fredinandcohnia sp.]|nr:SsrA-binding protein SmpB [Fredinandcohnia sp.]